MGIKLKNNAVGYLATAISANDSSIVLTPGTGANFPALAVGDYFYATLESLNGVMEIVKVTGRNGDVLTVLRAQEGTTAHPFPAGSRIGIRVTSASLVDAVWEVSQNVALATVKHYTSNVARLNVAQTWTAPQHMPGGGGIASNEALGAGALVSNTTGAGNTAHGVNALRSNTIGAYNTAHGANALRSNTTGAGNTAHGVNALRSNTTGAYNTAHGVNALYSNTTGAYNTAHGANALRSNTTYSNCTGLGAGAQVTGSNQVQLGNSATTVYAYGAVQKRSDIRDKADVRDTILGLDFILKLRPVDFRWDMREDYRPEPPEPPAIEKPSEDASEEEIAVYNKAMEEYEAKMQQWREASKLKNIVHDGSKKRSRYHHGLIAQEVEAVIKETGIDFGGYQDHSLCGGDDVKSIGYIELIAPLIKAVQELSAKVAALEAKHE